jgi:zinc/manganese transport system substrate-binding protein
MPKPRETRRFSHSYGARNPRRGPSRRELLAAGALALASPLARAQTPPHLAAVASFSILGDLVAEVGGHRLDLATIVGPDGDAHVYQPTPKDGKRLAGARIVFVNGLGFEGWIDRLIAASRTKARIVAVSRGVTPRKDIEGLDPHAWQSVANAKIYVANIRDALVEADPEAAEVFRTNAEAYLERLGALDSEIKAAIEAVPKSRRRVVSTHDAFGYFAARYGLEFIAPEGVSTEAEPSARDIARIIDAARAHKVAAIFLENVVDPRLAQRIAAETGAKIGGTLYSDALSGMGGPAPTYVQMMRHNVKQLTAALSM